MAEYAHPESLVSTEWVAEHGGDSNVRLVEVDVDTTAYDSEEHLFIRGTALQSKWNAL